MNLLQKFLLICSGSNLSIIKKTPTEWNKHAGIGGVILFTAIFAFLSASYALFTVFNNWGIATGVGLLWALMIFNLDRYIVSSFKGHSSIMRKIIQAIPRLVLALFLGIVISKPLELKIFEKEIDKQLNLIINRNKLQIEDSIQLRYNALASNYQQKGKSIENQLQRLEEEYKNASLDLEKEIIGTASETTSGKAGFGPNSQRKAKIKDEKWEAIQAFKKENQAKLDSVTQAQSRIQKNKEKEISQSTQVENNYNGLLARLQAYSELNDAHPIMHWASLFIMGIFIMMEVAPVLVKLMSPKGPYEHRMKWNDFLSEIYSDENVEKEKYISAHRIRKVKNSTKSSMTQ